MSIKKPIPQKTAPKKGLSDEEFIKKYEAGAVDLTPILNKGLPKITTTTTGAFTQQ